ncbi:MAG: CBS domain-containing protein [Candidatus Omnitrophota bacterium]
MNPVVKKFIFLIEIIKLPIIDSATGKKIGRLIDLSATMKEMYPKVNALIMRDRKSGKKFYIPWKFVKILVEEKGIFIENTPASFSEYLGPINGDIPLKETFWDKQIVDVYGSKVVRVNDLHLLKEGLGLWVVHMDIGFTGILRRLGCLKFVQFFVKLLSSCEMEDRLITWKSVQPVTNAIGQETLALKIHHSKLAELHPADLADILNDLSIDERITILRSLDPSTAAGTFQELPLKNRVQIAESIDQKLLLDLINEMPMDEVADLLSQLTKKKINSIFLKLPPEKVTQISSLLGHAQNIAGSIMNTEFVAARQTETASSVLEKIKKGTRKKESIYYIYVTDENDTLVGVITLQQLLMVAPEKIISDFMRKRIAKVKIDTKLKDVAEIFYKYDFTVVPVVDKLGKVQGIITIKDAFEAVFDPMKQESEEIK